MTDSSPPPGSIVWTDLTVPNAEKVRDFYAQVVGWRPEPVDMGEYSDFNMIAPGSEQGVAGVCHARGVNADLPALWLLYVAVSDLDASMKTCVELGGKVIAGPKGMTGKSRYCVVEDPAGAVLALFAQQE